MSESAGGRGREEREEREKKKKGMMVDIFFCPWACGYVLLCPSHT